MSARIPSTGLFAATRFFILCLFTCLSFFIAAQQAHASTCSVSGATVPCMSVQTSQWDYSFNIVGFDGPDTVASGGYAAAYGALAAFKQAMLANNSSLVCNVVVTGVSWNPETQFVKGQLQQNGAGIEGYENWWSAGAGSSCDPTQHPLSNTWLNKSRDVYCPGQWLGGQTDSGAWVCYLPTGYTGFQSQPQKELGNCQTGDGQNGQCKVVGNPINIGSGNKFQPETDYQGSGTFPLNFTRYYNSLPGQYGAYGSSTPLVNKSALYDLWRHSYSGRIQDKNGTVNVIRPQGRVLTFTLTNGQYVPDGDISATLVQLTDSSGNPAGWQYTAENDQVETYDVNGILQSIANRAGLKQVLAYDSYGNLTSVTDPFARKLQFTYNNQNQLASMTDPAGSTYSYTYASINGYTLLTAVTYPDGSKRSYVYDDPNLAYGLSGIIDEDGNRFATWTYDSNGYATLSSHAGGTDQLKITYNSDGTVTTNDALGAARTYTFQAVQGVDHVTQIKRGCTTSCTSSATESFTYDATGNLASHTDYNGNVTQYTYNSRGLQTSRTEAYGSTTTKPRTVNTTWHPTFRLPTQIAEQWRTTYLTYDANGNLTQKTITATTTGNPSRTWKYAYNINGQVTSMTDPDGNVTSYAYDAIGNLASMTNALNQVTNISSYDANGRPLSITDPNGLVMTLAYDARGRLTSEIAGAETTNFTYDAAGNITKISLPDGSSLAYTYDAAHRVTGISDQLDNKITYTLDAMGNRTQVSTYDPSGALTHTYSRIMTYLNVPAKDLGAQSQTTAYAYDNNLNIISVTDPLSHVTGHAFDALNRLVTITDPNKGTTKLAYDSLDNLVQVTDPRGLKTTYNHDGLSNLFQLISPDTGTTNMTYDVAGNMLTKTDADNNKATYTYDALNRVSQIAYSDTKVAFHYDDAASNGIGRLYWINDNWANPWWNYDQHGRVTLKDNWVGSSMTLPVKYAYDAQGRLASLTLPDGQVLNYTYNQDKVTGISVGTTVLVSNVQYQPFGAPKSLTFGNGAAYSRSFDTDGRPSNFPVGATTWTVGYDAASRITGLNDATGTKRTAAYDSLDRLTSFTSPSISQSYVYDANGNRTSQSVGGTTYPYTYSSTSNRLGSMSTKFTYTYDAAGNMTSDGRYTYTYDPRGRLIKVMNGTTTVAQYAYDGQGRRTWKWVNGIGTTAFAYDEAGHLIGEYNYSTNKTIREYVWLGDTLVAILDGGVTPYYMHTDQIGVPRVVKNGANTIVWSWDVDPFGNNSPSGTYTMNLRLPGQYYDAETGRNYNYFRDYDPVIGRYIKSDPAGLAAGINTYLYAADAPLSKIDFLGLDWTDWQENIKGTIEGRTADSAVLRQRTSYGFNTNQDVFVALPDENLKGRNVEIEVNGQRMIVPVGDIGPWNGGHSRAGTDFNDPYWDDNSRPEAECGYDLRTRKTNNAGIDISAALAEKLGLKGNVQLRWRGLP